IAAMKDRDLLAINSQNWHNLGEGTDPEVAKDLGYTTFDDLPEVVKAIPEHKAQISRALGGDAVSAAITSEREATRKQHIAVYEERLGLTDHVSKTDEE